jgi:hypothetical protein
MANFVFKLFTITLFFFGVNNITTVQAQQCTINMTGSTSLTTDCGQAVNFNILPALPSDAQGLSCCFHWVWDFGDPNSGALNSLSGTNQNLISDGFNANHVYQRPGNYRGYLRLINNDPTNFSCSLNMNNHFVLLEGNSIPSYIITFDVVVQASSGNTLIISGIAGVCQGNSTTTLSVPSTPNTNYQWSILTALGVVINLNVGLNSNTYSTPTNLQAGIYIYKVEAETDCSHCASSGIYTIVVQRSPDLDYMGNLACEGSLSDVTLTVIPTVHSNSNCGPLTYLWDTGETTPSIVAAPIIGANHSVTVTCSNSHCSSSISFPIQSRPAPIVSLVNQQIVCDGTSSLVSLDINPIGGGYTFSWNDGSIISTDEDLINMPIANPEVTLNITDHFGCTAVQNFNCLNPCSSN